MIWAYRRPHTACDAPVRRPSREMHGGLLSSASVRRASAGSRQIRCAADRAPPRLLPLMRVDWHRSRIALVGKPWQNARIIARFGRRHRSFRP
ncbi:hypothetical protein WS68_03870 [Burkholderia sp. TSV86]|nr:hypothetical protein WS68_03870 [Burkholderia sp. TSV86]